MISVARPLRSVSSRLVLAGVAWGALVGAEPVARASPRAASEPPPVAAPTAGVDPALQAVARRLLAEAYPVLGGIVALHAPSGRILAWQEFARPGHAGHPNSHALAPAASLFKIVTSVALYERSELTPTTPVCISGGEHALERVHLRPPTPGTEHVVCRPFEEALGASRNAVFAQLATRHLVGRDLLEVAERLGFNRPLDAGFRAEMGTLEVLEDELGFARTAAGFHGSRLSVGGAARLALVIASAGRPPRIGGSPDADELAPGEPVVQARTAQRLRRMMEYTVHSGTSVEAFTAPDGRPFLGGIRVAGKTGTLRPSSRSPTTSWFIGFAPSRAPELVVSVMLDNGPVWRRKANQLARDLLRAYFRGAPGVTHPFEPDG